jgi:hypothetical protein
MNLEYHDRYQEGEGEEIVRQTLWKPWMELEFQVGMTSSGI